MLSFTTNLLHKTYVTRFLRRRDLFDKTAYNPDWIPRQKPYHRNRKPSQIEWSSNQPIAYPQLIPPLHPPMNFKTYLRTVVESEELEKAKRSREYILGDIRAGDLVDITYQHTFESDVKVVHRALVLGMRRRNSLSAAIEVAIRLGGMSLKAVFMIHCPKLIKIQLVARGSGNFVSNIKSGWKKLGRKELNSPRIKKGVMKKRQGVARKRKARVSGSIRYDRVEIPLVRRVERK